MAFFTRQADLSLFREDQVQGKRPFVARCLRYGLAGLIGLAGVAGMVAGGTPNNADAATTITVYGDSLADNWEDQSWDSNVDYSSGTGYSSDQSISWKITSAWGGLFLQTDRDVSASSEGSLMFALRASERDQRISIYLKGGDNQKLSSPRRLSNLGGDPPAGQWKIYDIPLSKLNAAGKSISGIVFIDAEGHAQARILVDQVKLSASSSTTTPTVTATPSSAPAPTSSSGSGWNQIKSAGMEPGNFSEFNATSVADGSLAVSSSSPGAAEGSDFARAAINGGGNGYARGQWELSWGQGTVYRTEASLFLPSGFYSKMQGTVQLIGWDTYPTLSNQMRLAIWNSDKKARLFLKTDGSDTALTGTFSIPEGRWVQVAIEQKISDSGGWSKVYLDGQLVAQGSGDTATPYRVTRIRYGIVAIDESRQTNPLTLYFDKVRLLTPQ